MLFIKRVRVFNKNILFDFASLLVSVIMLGPFYNVVEHSLFQKQDKFIETIIETQISDLFPDYVVEIEKVEVTSNFSVTPVEIKIQNMSVAGPEANFIFPESELKFGLESIFFGGMPQSVDLNGVKVLVNGKTKEKGLNASNPEIVHTNKFISKLILGFSETISMRSFPRRIQVKLDEFLAVKKENLHTEKIIINDANLYLSRSKQDKFRALVSFKNSNIGRLDVNIEANLADLNWRATANMQSVDVRPFRAYLPKVVRENLIEGFVSGELNAEFEAAQLISVDGHFDSKKIGLNTAVAEKINVSQFSGWFDYDVSKKAAELNNLVLNLEPELKLKAAIRIDNIGDPDAQFSITAETRDAPLRAITPYFLTRQFSTFNDLLDNHTSGGVLDFASIKLLAVKEPNTNNIDWQKFHLDGQLSKLRITASNRQFKILAADTKSVFSAKFDKHNLKNKLLLSSTISDGLIKITDSERVVQNISGKLELSFDENKIRNASIKFLQPEAGEVLFTAEFPKLEDATAKIGERTFQEFKKNFVVTKDTIFGALAFETEKFDADLLLELWP